MKMKIERMNNEHSHRLTLNCWAIRSLNGTLQTDQAIKGIINNIIYSSIEEFHAKKKWMNIECVSHQPEPTTISSFRLKTKLEGNEHLFGYNVYAQCRDSHNGYDGKRVEYARRCYTRRRVSLAVACVNLSKSSSVNALKWFKNKKWEWKKHARHRQCLAHSTHQRHSYCSGMHLVIF